MVNFYRCLLLLIFLQRQHASSMKFPDFDPYATLSLRPTASPTQIQKAYRLKARETHPDKNSSPNANEEFRLVSEAFDILSNPQRKRTYDAQQKRAQRLKEEQRRREERRRYAEHLEREEALRRKREMIQKARAGYDRVLKWNKLSQMEETVMDYENNVYTVNVLVMFVGNKAAEKKGVEDYFFPYPFCGEGISAVRNDLLVAAKVRHNHHTPLTRQFKAPSNSDNPYFVFAKKGDPLHHYYTYHPKRHQLNLHEDWRHWVQSLLLIRGIIVNRHSLPVTIFILRDRKIAYIQEKLNPYFEIELSFHPGDRILAFDARLDNFPGGRGHSNERILEHAENIAILDTTVTSNTEYVIYRMRCYDLSTQCFEWSMTIRGRSSQCHQNPEFMHHICPKSCEVCSDGILSEIRYILFHYPVHKSPLFIGEAMRTMRVFMEDAGRVGEVSNTSAAICLMLGLLLAFNFVFFGTATKPSGDAAATTKSIMTFRDRLVMVLAVCLLCVLKQFVSSKRHMLPLWLWSFHSDFGKIARETDMCLILVSGGIIAHVYINTLIVFLTKDDVKNGDLAVFAAVSVMLVSAVLVFLTLIVHNDSSSIMRWNHLWNYMKNAAFVFVVLGSFAIDVFKPFAKMLRQIILAENITIFLIPNAMVIGGIYCLSEFDRGIYLDLLYTWSKTKAAMFVLVAYGMMGGLLYMKLIDALANEEVPMKNGSQKEKVA